MEKLNVKIAYGAQKENEGKINEDILNNEILKIREGTVNIEIRGGKSYYTNPADISDTLGWTDKQREELNKVILNRIN